MIHFCQNVLPATNLGSRRRSMPSSPLYSEKMTRKMRPVAKRLAALRRRPGGMTVGSTGLEESHGCSLANRRCDVKES